MSKPKKLTEGHSSGPQAYWDSISDAKKDAEIERLRKENERLREEVKDLQSVLRSYQTGFADEQ